MRNEKRYADAEAKEEGGLRKVDPEALPELPVALALKFVVEQGSNRRLFFVSELECLLLLTKLLDHFLAYADLLFELRSRRASFTQRAHQHLKALFKSCLSRNLKPTPKPVGQCPAKPSEKAPNGTNDETKECRLHCANLRRAADKFRLAPAGRAERNSEIHVLWERAKTPPPNMTATAPVVAWDSESLIASANRPSEIARTRRSGGSLVERRAVGAPVRSTSVSCVVNYLGGCMRRDRLADLLVRLREVNGELRRTPCPLSALALKAERAELQRAIKLERERRAA